MNLTRQQKRNIVREVRGIAREIDIEFDRMVSKSAVTLEKIEQTELHLNKILDLILMYQNALNSIQT